MPRSIDLGTVASAAYRGRVPDDMLDPAVTTRRLVALQQRPPARLHGTFPRGHSAVMVLVVTGSQPGLVLTRRASRLTTDPGFVALPGGRLDPGETPEDAARRETEEEVGIPAHGITVHGRLDETWNGAGFRIIPVVGSVRGPIDLHPAEAEVTAAAVVSLGAALADHHHDVVTKPIDGHDFLDDVITVPAQRGDGASAQPWELYGPTADIVRDLAAWLTDSSRDSIARRQRDLDHFAARRW